MPVEINKIGEPPATIRFTQPEGPFTVGSDELSTESTGFFEHNPGEEPETVTHIQDGAHLADVRFEQPGPEIVHIEGFGPDGGDDDVSTSGRHAAQTKIVAPPADEKLISTEGAEVK